MQPQGLLDGTRREERGWRAWSRSAYPFPARLPVSYLFLVISSTPLKLGQHIDIDGVPGGSVELTQMPE